MEEYTPTELLGAELIALLASEDPALTAAEINQLLLLIDPTGPFPFDVAMAATKALIQRKAS